MRAKTTKPTKLPLDPDIYTNKQTYNYDNYLSNFI